MAPYLANMFLENLSSLNRSFSNFRRDKSRRNEISWLFSIENIFTLDKFNKCESGSSSHVGFIYNSLNQKLSITGIEQLCIERNTIAWVIMVEYFS